jgi:chromosome partitioning protein
MTEQAQVIAVANQKGGVAKTTTAINLGASLALAGRRVLLIDLDPQANLTSGLGLKGQSGPAGTVYQALTIGDPSGADSFVVPSPVDKLRVMPADRNLTGAEIELVLLDGREERLKRLLGPLRSSYDLILIDSPPSLGLLTLNALVAADSVLIPLNCEYFALEGIADLLATVDRVRASFNPGLALEGVVLTMYDDRTNLGQQVSANIRDFFGSQVYSTVIPRNIRLGEAPSHGLPVILYDTRSRGAEAYVALAREFLARRQPHPVAQQTDPVAGEAVDTTSASPAPVKRAESAASAPPQANRLAAPPSMPDASGLGSVAAPSSEPAASTPAPSVAAGHPPGVPELE